MEVVVWGLIGIVTAIAFYTDHTKMIIPNWLTVGGIASGLLVHSVSGGMSGAGHSLLGMAGSSLALLLIYACKGVEAGDVKLFAAFGAIGGLEIGLTGLVYSLAAAAVAGSVVLIRLKIKERQAGRPIRKRVQFPFMYAVLPGFLLTFLALGGL